VGELIVVVFPYSRLTAIVFTFPFHRIIGSAFRFSSVSDFLTLASW